MAKQKKSNLNKKHFLKLAFEQAKNNLGSTGSNPSVGCVIERNGSIISSGYTSLNGRPHAEHIALKNKINFKGANMYVTLEPCSHYGKTPPCTSMIIKKKIKNVYFPISDFDIRSSNKSYEILKKKNINVKKNILKHFAKDFYYSYFLNRKKNLPLIDAKIALSNDYYSVNKRSKWITNIHSRKRGQLLRSFYDCVISTSKTINKDNPKLDCRIKGLENKSPTIIIIDRFLKIKKNLNLIEKRGINIFLFTSTTNKNKEIYLRNKGVKILKTKMNNKNDFSKIFKKLYNMGFSRIFVESGVTFLNYLIKNSFIHNLFIFNSMYNLKKNGLNKLDKLFVNKARFQKRINVNLFGDNLIKLKLK